MKFRNYCLVVIGDTAGVKDEIAKISETVPNFLDGKGLFIATFSSAVSPKELTDWFTLHRRNFMIFDLNPESAGFNINRKETHEGLFGFLKTMNLDDETAKLLREIRQTADTRSDRIDVKPIKNGPSGFTVTEKVITEKDVDKMTKHDREVLWNKLIDNGVENLTEQDKLVLGYLAKY
jgi:hypothetical protein